MISKLYQQRKDKTEGTLVNSHYNLPNPEQPPAGGDGYESSEKLSESDGEEAYNFKPKDSHSPQPPHELTEEELMKKVRDALGYDHINLFKDDEGSIEGLKQVHGLKAQIEVDQMLDDRRAKAMEEKEITLFNNKELIDKYRKTHGSQIVAKKRKLTKDTSKPTKLISYRSDDDFSE
mmetsp:Transcript_34703/g.53226  ORF Transcript_34703/g.53226 Transcript_34703/m.53226 type:complete len:177 (+) Transcript_34703:3-533(+)